MVGSIGVSGLVGDREGIQKWWEGGMVLRME